MEGADVDAVKKRNAHKADILCKLYSTGKIRGIYYRLLKSCNLEHVLYNELKDFTDEEKEELSDDFADLYEGKVQDFIEFISNGLKVKVVHLYLTWNIHQLGSKKFQCIICRMQITQMTSALNF